jgi:hypothetical protein
MNGRGNVIFSLGVEAWRTSTPLDEVRWLWKSILTRRAVPWLTIVSQRYRQIIVHVIFAQFSNLMRKNLSGLVLRKRARDSRPM